MAAADTTTPQDPLYLIPQSLLQRITDYLTASPSGAVPAGEVVQILAAMQGLTPASGSPKATP